MSAPAQARSWRESLAIYAQPRVVALSRTENIDRIPRNADIFDFVLGDEDMAAIAALKAPGSRIVDPPHLAPAWD